MSQTAEVVPASIPERITQAATFATAVVVLLTREPVVTETKAFVSKGGAHARRTLLLRGLREIGATDVRTTVRKAAEGWKWYAELKA